MRRTEVKGTRESVYEIKREGGKREWALGLT